MSATASFDFDALTIASLHTTAAIVRATRAIDNAESLLIHGRERATKLRRYLEDRYDGILRADAVLDNALTGARRRLTELERATTSTSASTSAPSASLVVMASVEARRLHELIADGEQAQKDTIVSLRLVRGHQRSVSRFIDALDRFGAVIDDGEQRARAATLWVELIGHLRDDVESLDMGMALLLRRILSMTSEFHGVDLRDPDPLGGTDSMQRVTLPLFGPLGQPSYSDVAQGGVGDCMLLSSLAALALRDPEAIRRMIRDNHDGTFTVTFRDGVTITVDGDFYFTRREPSYASAQNSMWVQVIEKAAAQRVGSYDGIEGNSLSDEISDGEAVWADEIWGTSARLYVGGQHDTDEAVRLGVRSGALMTMGVETAPPDYPIADGHQYAVLGTREIGETTMVILYNPWGVDGESYSTGPQTDGRIEVPLATFASDPNVWFHIAD